MVRLTAIQGATMQNVMVWFGRSAADIWYGRYDNLYRVMLRPGRTSE